MFGILGSSPGKLATGRCMCLSSVGVEGTGKLVPGCAAVLLLQLTEEPYEPYHLALSKALSQISSHLSPHP